MFVRFEPIAQRAIDQSARAISARSRRTARAVERQVWTAQDEHRRVERQRSARPAAAQPALTLLRRA